MADHCINEADFCTLKKDSSKQAIISMFIDLQETIDSYQSCLQMKNVNTTKQEKEIRRKERLKKLIQTYSKSLHLKYPSLSITKNTFIKSEDQIRDVIKHQEGFLGLMNKDLKHSKRVLEEEIKRNPIAFRISLLFSVESVPFLPNFANFHNCSLFKHNENFCLRVRNCLMNELEFKLANAKERDTLFKLIRKKKREDKIYKQTQKRIKEKMMEVYQNLSRSTKKERQSVGNYKNTENSQFSRIGNKNLIRKQCELYEGSKIIKLNSAKSTNVIENGEELTKRTAFSLEQNVNQHSPKALSYFNADLSINKEKITEIKRNCDKIVISKQKNPFNLSIPPINPLHLKSNSVNSARLGFFSTLS
jgi:hypothetical protein